jgi:uncharacterized protein (DUF305 family)
MTSCKHTSRRNAIIILVIVVATLVGVEGGSVVSQERKIHELSGWQSSQQPDEYYEPQRYYYYNGWGQIPKPPDPVPEPEPEPEPKPYYHYYYYYGKSSKGMGKSGKGSKGGYYYGGKSGKGGKGGYYYDGKDIQDVQEHDNGGKWVFVYYDHPTPNQYHHEPEPYWPYPDPEPVPYWQEEENDEIDQPWGYWGYPIPNEPEPKPEPLGKSGKGGSGYNDGGSYGSSKGSKGSHGADYSTTEPEPESDLESDLESADLGLANCDWGGDYNHDPELCHANCSGDICYYTGKVDLFASEFGAYYFEECPEAGNYPKLTMEIGKTYRFVQNDVSNWFHPFGFAYGQDGALADLPELEEEYISYQRNGEDITLDGYEPEFQWPIEQWVEGGEYYVDVTLPDDYAYTEDLFYFCHVHRYFGARIKLMRDGKIINPLPLPEHRYVPPPPSEYDQQCGTYGLVAIEAAPGEIGDGWPHSQIGDFRLPNKECPREFVCEENKSTFATCTDAIDCHMFNGMTTNENYNEIALFLHQMIPHHQQAVNQAKSLLKTSLLTTGDYTCPKENLGSDEFGCVLTNLILSIINAQNAQVQTFRMLLMSYEFPEFDNCDLKKTGGEHPKLSSPYEFEDISRYSNAESDESSSNLNPICRGSCSTQEDGKEVCVFTAKLAIYESDLGAWYFEECGENNLYPTIGVEIGTLTRFVQEDITNWYHPLGFAYFVDGAHNDKPEVEEKYLRYRLNGENIGLEGQGAYEESFVRSTGEWLEAGSYNVELLFNNQEYDKDLFYFCHIHYAMSGRIKLLKNGIVVNKEDEPVIPYTHPPPSEYDRSCGTYGLSEFQLPNPECPKTFVCDGSSQFADCINTMNCYMMAGMTTGASDDDNTIFFHQMIPHHVNAVNMAKALFKTNILDCPDLLEDTNDCTLSNILWDIIGNQNLQIQTMYQLLADQGAPTKNDCVVKIVHDQHLR